MKKLIKLGSEDLNMFEKPIFLHDDNIMKLREAKEATLESVGVGQEVGEVDLAKTKFPIGVGYGGLLIIALDPLWKINDLDRTDNVFVQYVAVNGTDENGDWVSGAKVEILGNAKKVTTNKRGEFWRLLLPGRYQVQAWGLCVGDTCKRSKIIRIEVKTDQPTIVDLILSTKGLV